LCCQIENVIWLGLVKQPKARACVNQIEFDQLEIRMTDYSKLL